MQDIGVKKFEKSGDDKSINFRPSPNFKHMKKYLKSKFEEAGCTGATGFPAHIEQELANEADNKANITVAVQPPLPPGTPPPDYPPNFVLKKEVIDDGYENNTPQQQNENRCETHAKAKPVQIESTDKPKKIMCKDFVRGTCKRVPCNYNHELDLTQLKGVYKFCRDFANGKCKRPICFFVHATTFEKENFFRTGALPPHTLSHLKDPAIAQQPQPVSEGSICFLAQPFGAVFSGPLVDFFGRKKANFLANVPHLIAWILMYYAYNLPILFTASALLGLGTGVMEAPINAYVGEITEASTRGALCTLTQIFTSAGVLLMYFLGTVVHRRTAALICLSAPIASMICVLFVPETPVWLLSRGREKDAIRSLRYLRGWTTTENIRDEFDKLVVNTKNLERCIICCNTQGSDDLNCEHHMMNPIKRKIIKLRYVMFCKETMRPLVLTIMYFSFHILSGYAPLKPNLVNVCGALGLPGSRNNVMIIAGVLTFVAALSTVAIVKLAGKRKLAITAMLGCAISTTGLAIYARANLDPSVSSYDTSTFPTAVSHIPEVLFFMLVVFSGLAIPWVLLGEVFPFRSRSTSQGLAAAANYVINFLAAKTFINFESGLGLWGALAVYAIFGYLGVIYLYFFLPETEGKTLIEIESYYNGKLRTFADDPFINLFRKSK